MELRAYPTAFGYKLQSLITEFKNDVRGLLNPQDCMGWHYNDMSKMWCKESFSLHAVFLADAAVLGANLL